MELTTESIVVVSTLHITESDDTLLEKEMSEFICLYKYDKGWIISTTDEMIPTEEYSDTLKQEGFSDAFIALVRKAFAQGCTFLFLDPNGLQYADLEKFNW